MTVGIYETIYSILMGLFILYLVIKAIKLKSLDIEEKEFADSLENIHNYTLLNAIVSLIPSVIFMSGFYFIVASALWVITWIVIMGWGLIYITYLNPPNNNQLNNSEGEANVPAVESIQENYERDIPSIQIAKTTNPEIKESRPIKIQDLDEEKGTKKSRMKFLHL